MSSWPCLAGRPTIPPGKRCCCAGCWMGVRVRSRRGGRMCRGGRGRRWRLAGWGRRRGGACCWLAVRRCGRGVRVGVEPPVKTEVLVPGQLALVLEEQAVVAAAVWETLPQESQLQVAVRLARLLD